MTPGDLIFPSRRAHEYTHTHARKRARAYKGSVRRIARGDLVTRCGEVHAETGDPRRHTAVSIHGSLEAERGIHVQLLPTAGAVPFDRGGNEGRKGGRRAHRHPRTGLRVEGSVSSARLKIVKVVQVEERSFERLDSNLLVVEYIYIYIYESRRETYRIFIEATK